MEHVLEEVYDPKGQKLNKVAKDINKKKGPRQLSWPFKR